MAKGKRGSNRGKGKEDRGVTATLETASLVQEVFQEENENAEVV